jgi:hypothetical protein
MVGSFLGIFPFTVSVSEGPSNAGLELEGPPRKVLCELTIYSIFSSPKRSLAPEPLSPPKAVS